MLSRARASGRPKACGNSRAISTCGGKAQPVRDRRHSTPLNSPSRFGATSRTMGDRARLMRSRLLEPNCHTLDVAGCGDSLNLPRWRVESRAHKHTYAGWASLCDPIPSLTASTRLALEKPGLNFEASKLRWVLDGALVFSAHTKRRGGGGLGSRAAGAQPEHCRAIWFLSAWIKTQNPAVSSPPVSANTPDSWTHSDTWDLST